jgi:hypothetical protein
MVGVVAEEAVEAVVAVVGVETGQKADYPLLKFMI